MNWVNKQTLQTWWWGGSSNLTEYTVDPASPSSWQQWLLRSSLWTFRNAPIMWWLCWVLGHRNVVIYLKVKTSIGVESILFP